MVRTLIANGDFDDYFKGGAEAAEFHANASKPIKIHLAMPRPEINPMQFNTSHIPNNLGYIAIRQLPDFRRG